MLHTSLGAGRGPGRHRLDLPRPARAPGTGRMRSTVVGLLVAVCQLLPTVSLAQSAGPDDASIYARIDGLRPVAAALVIDGDCSDWGPIPFFEDPLGDALGGDSARDIVGVAIAPMDDGLAVRIDVAGTPPADAADYWLEVDYRRQQYWDLTFSLSASFAFFDVRPELGEAGLGRLAWTSAHQIAVGSQCIEVRIPYAALETQLPASMQGQLSGSGARSWLRVRATTGEPLDSFDTEIDYANAVGSFRLVPTPFELDPALPAGAESPYPTVLPLLGVWYLGQGTHGVGSHQFVPWGYDWHRVDDSLEAERPERSPVLDDNFSYGEPIFAPEAGTAGSGVVDDQPDCPPYAACPPGASVNNLFLELPGDRGILFSHTIPGSIRFLGGEPVAAGAQIGLVGNSGSAFSWPHLHHEIRDTSLAGDPSVPLALSHVDVGLNPDLDRDPWRRRLASWQPREGFFARRAADPVPATLVWGRAALLVLLGWQGLRRLREG